MLNIRTSKQIRQAPPPTQVTDVCKKAKAELDPVERNEKINKEYNKIDKSFTKYLGVNNVAKRRRKNEARQPLYRYSGTIMYSTKT